MQVHAVTSTVHMDPELMMSYPSIHVTKLLIHTPQVLTELYTCIRRIMTKLITCTCQSIDQSIHMYIADRDQIIYMATTDPDRTTHMYTSDVIKLVLCIYKLVTRLFTSIPS